MTNIVSVQRTAAALGIFFFAAVIANSLSASSNDAVDISADHLFVDHEKKSARFEGHVKAAFGKLRLTCSKLSLVYNDTGEIAELTAWGGVTVVTEDAKATAGRARLDARRNLLILDETPSIAKGPHHLTGSRIEVRLDTGQVEVTEARGVFQLKKGAAP